jgi:hypothetical protein
VAEAATHKCDQAVAVLVEDAALVSSLMERLTAQPRHVESVENKEI